MGKDRNMTFRYRDYLNAAHILMTTEEMYIDILEFDAGFERYWVGWTRVDIL